MSCFVYNANKTSSLIVRYVFCIALMTCMLVSMIPHANAQTLKDALREAYISNPSLRAARAGLEATDESVPQASAGWRPNISITSALTRNYANSFPRRPTDGDGDADWYTTKSATLSASQSLYDGGKTSALVAQAEAGVRAGRAALSVTEQTVFLNVIQAFVNVVREQATLELNTNNVEVLKRQLQATRDRFDVGEITLTDVAQAEARLSNSVAIRESARGNLASSRAAFEQFVGRTPISLSAPEALALLPESLEESIALALEKNPVLLRAIEVDRAALWAQESERADVKPTLAITGNLSRSLDATSADDRRTSGNVGLSLNIPLYQGGGAYSDIREAQKTLNQRRIQVEETRRDVIEGAKSAWENLRSADAQIVSRRAQVTAAEIALEGVRQEAEVGARTTLDVLDAEQELLDAQVALVSAERDQQIASYNLLAAVGGLNAVTLELNVDIYDPSVHYEATKNKLFWWDEN